MILPAYNWRTKWYPCCDPIVWPAPGLSFWTNNKTVFFQTWHLRSWRERRKKTRPWLRIVRERRNMKRFAAIEFERKWIIPFCSPTHLASDWYWTLIAQINLWLSNRLVNINHLYLPRQNSSSVFRSRQDLKCQVWKKTVLNIIAHRAETTNKKIFSQKKRHVVQLTTMKLYVTQPIRT